MSRWRFLYYSHTEYSPAALPDGRTVFEGSAEEAVTAAAAIPRRDDAETAILSHGTVEPLPDLPPPWYLRVVRERKDGRGWNLLEDALDHGAWHGAPGSAISYALQRTHANRILAVSAVDRADRTVRIVLHDDRERDTGLYGPSSSMVIDQAASSIGTRPSDPAASR